METKIFLVFCFSEGKNGLFEAVGFINNMILSSHEQSSDVISYSNWRVCDTSQGSPKIAFVCLFADKDGIYIAVFIAFKLKRKCWIYERNAIAFFKQRLDVILSFFINRDNPSLLHCMCLFLYSSHHIIKVPTGTGVSEQMNE